MKDVLFISYDGLLDPLGGSQILPYVRILTKQKYRIYILSFEKKHMYVAGVALLKANLLKDGITWTPLSFTTKLGGVGKLWDLAKMYTWCSFVVLNRHVTIVHARGHLAAKVALFLKQLFGIKLIFDFRGLWVDERVDKGGWVLSNPLHKLQYQYFKWVEKKCLLYSDHVVVLTHAVIDEVMYLGNVPRDKVTVIPSCADFEHFLLADRSRRHYARKIVAVPEKALVLGYLGSVGPMYMLGRFFRLFELATESNLSVHAILITQDTQLLKRLMESCVPPTLMSRIHVCSGNREEVPELIAAMDILVSFIQPSYARMAASPTKLAECFSAGIPAICNDGVGDVSQLMEQLDAGCIVDPNSDTDLINIISRLDEIKAKGGSRLREQARLLLGLEVAAERYRMVYEKIGATTC